VTPVDGRLAGFIQVLPEPCYLLTPSGEILAANGAASRLSGLALHELIGRSLASLLLGPSEKAQQYLSLCSRSRQLVPGGFAWRTSGEAVDIRCDGAVVEPRGADRPAVIFLRCRPRAEAADHFILLNEKIRALTQEVLERKKAEMQRDELLVSERAARLEAEHNSRVKDEFLSTLSHELRTPLNAIMGWADLIRRDGLENSSSLRQGLEVIDRNARAQLRLVEDLLDVSQIISGKIRLDVQRVDVARVIEAAVDSIRPAAEARNIRLQVTLDALAPTLKGDPNRLQQIVWNLLTNAIKFTPKGGRVQVVLSRINSHLDLTVSDNGRGISPEFIPRVFDRFRQQDSSTTRHVGGLGLGLAIVKELAELHGGSVHASSPGEGQGSSFTVTLPLPAVQSVDEDHLAAVHPRATEPAGESVFGAPLDGLNVMVIDDDTDGAELLRRLLQSRGAHVTVAGSAHLALAVIEASPPDIVISDIGMPDMDGYELIRELRRLPAAHGGRIPAIALTAFARSGDRTRALLAGFQLHLSKPIEAPELLAAIASLAGRLTP
jgi:signal transduction histidine kinase